MSNRPKPTKNSAVDLGVSPRALSIARTIDRLPDGTYTIRISKRLLESWQFEVARDEAVIKKELEK